MKYNVIITQKRKVTYESGKSYINEEIIKGTADKFEDVQTIVGLATQMFANTEVTVTAMSDNYNVEEEE